MGDVHACMGDGEIMVTGVEIPAVVTVTIEVLKGTSIKTPYLEDSHSCYTIASDENIEAAIEVATYEMAKIILDQLPMSFHEAGLLLSALFNLDFCPVVDPKRTVLLCVSPLDLPPLF